MFDVIAVSLEKPPTVRVLDRGLTQEDADATVRFAVIRRGVEKEFFAKVPAGKYKDGDTYKDR